MEFLRKIFLAIISLPLFFTPADKTDVQQETQIEVPGTQGFEKPARILKNYQTELFEYNHPKTETTQHYYTCSRNQVTQTDRISNQIPGALNTNPTLTNCSRYAKWISDGFYYTNYIGEKQDRPRLIVQRLKDKKLVLRGNSDTLRYERSREPFFGLDWNRNIAMQVERIKYGTSFLYNYHDVDFSLYSQYVPDRGFPIEDLPLVLKEQTLMHPERWYLVSINGPYGNPEIIQNYHIAVVFSYFHIYQGKYTFRFNVFETSRQTSFEYLLKRYPGTYCHLVWLDEDENFELTLQ